MRISATTLVLTCVALLAGVDRAVAQQGPSYSGLAGDWVSPGFGQSPGGCWRGGCGPRVWGSAEFLLGFRSGRQVPPLVTTSPPTTSQGNAGVLGLDTTTILFGGEGLHDNPQPGGRAEVGLWLGPAAQLGLGGSFMGLHEDSVGFSASSDGSTILARPFFNTLLDQEASQLVAYPGIVRGSINAHSENQLYSAEAFLRKRLAEGPAPHPVFFVTDTLAIMAAKVRSLFYLPGTQAVCIQEVQTPPSPALARLDLIGGYQFSRIDDSLSITNNLVSLDPSFLGQIGTTLDAFDSFDARNDFHGGTLGLKSVTYSPGGRWSLTMLGKVALGNMRQIVTIDGQTVVTVPGGPSATSTGGLLTQTSNIGRYVRDRFAVVPEARISLDYNITPSLSLGVGYDFMYWNRVVLSGDQVDTQVDVTQTLSDPSFAFRESDFFVHAVTLLLQVNH